MIVVFKAWLLVKPGIIPKFCKAHSAPNATKGELNRLEAAGIMERVTHSDWDAPIIAFCICGDYKVMVNGALDVDLSLSKLQIIVCYTCNKDRVPKQIFVNLENYVFGQ